MLDPEKPKVQIFYDQALCTYRQMVGNRSDMYV
jgi:hypothetical protein